VVNNKRDNVVVLPYDDHERAEDLALVRSHRVGR
jgi:hypothetical protein